MTRPSHDLREEARLWAIRVQDPGFDGWDDLAEWLEGDADRLAAYEDALESDAWASELLATAPAPALRLVQPEPELRAPARQGWFRATGLAAALVAVLGGWLLFGRTASEIATPPGERRLVQLADGSEVTLNGATRIRLDGDAPRHVVLVEGEALFSVRHDAKRPFLVDAGDRRLLDLGTVFNVVSDGATLDVAVAEGAVMYEPGAGGIRLGAGHGLRVARAGDRPVLRYVSPAGVGAWKRGQLEFDDVPLDLVARDLARNTGLRINAAPGAGDARFTGTLDANGPPDALFARAGPLLGVRFARRGDGWTMTVNHGPAP